MVAFGKSEKMRQISVKGDVKTLTIDLAIFSIPSYIYIYIYKVLIKMYAY